MSDLKKEYEELNAVINPTFEQCQRIDSIVEEATLRNVREFVRELPAGVQAYLILMMKHHFWTVTTNEFLKINKLYPDWV